MIPMVQHDTFLAHDFDRHLSDLLDCQSRIIVPGSRREEAVAQSISHNFGGSRLVFRVRAVSPQPTPPVARLKNGLLLLSGCGARSPHRHETIVPELKSLRWKFIDPQFVEHFSL